MASRSRGGCSFCRIQLAAQQETCSAQLSLRIRAHSVLLRGFCVGKRSHSLILEAAGKPVLTDSLTSFGMVAGLGLVMVAGWKPFDPLIAVAGNILWSGGWLAWRSAVGLLDYFDPETESTSVKSSMRFALNSMSTTRRALPHHRLPQIIDHRSSLAVSARHARGRRPSNSHNARRAPAIGAVPARRSDLTWNRSKTTRPCSHRNTTPAGPASPFRRQ